MFSISTMAVITIAACSSICSPSFGHDLKGFDDSIMFHLNFPGLIEYNKREEIQKQESMTVMTNRKEKYDCALPSLEASENTTEKVYTGPSPFELVSSLFSSSACSYRIESYWTYEVCHGHYIKQYHEEREGKSLKIQEYYLGKWNKQKTDEYLEKEEKQKEAVAAASMDGHKNTKLSLQYKKVLTSTLPYFEVEMTDGTLCDLNNDLPRVTKVLYVCFSKGKNDVFSLKETSTCNYEIIILTPVLCTHPDFKPQESVVSVINCIPWDNFTPKKPKSLMAMEVASMKLQYQKLRDFTKNIDNAQEIAVVNIKDGNFRMEILEADKLRAMLNEESTDEDKPVTAADETPATQENSPKPAKDAKKINKLEDTSPVTAFLQGKNCLTGGTGWWKYEFCYGRYVRQYHVDKKGENSLMLGFFDETLHKRWLSENELKRQQMHGTKPQLTHFYQGGTLCEKTGERRQVEVKLKCMENAPSKSAVSLYLMEPKTCQYILGVESPIICDIIQKADRDGLVPMPELTTKDTEKIAKATATADGTTEAKGEGIFLGNAIVEDFEVRFEND